LCWPGGSGKRSSGSSDDRKWLISKEDAHVEKDRLVPDTADARKVLKALGSTALLSIVK